MAAPPMGLTPPAKGLFVAALIDEIERRLTEPPDLASRLEEPNLPATREAVAQMWDALDVIHFAGHGDPHSAGRLETQGLALLRSYRSFHALRMNRPRAAAVILSACVSAVASESPFEGQMPWAEIRQELARIGDDEQLETPAGPESPEWLVLFSHAVEEVISRNVTKEHTRSALRSLMTHLDLGQDDLGRLFGVSGETVRRWERGGVRIPSERGAAILAAESALRRLLEVFRPERLPLVVRRKADLFAGETALEWILRGRIGEVVERYDRTFLYQA